MKDHGPPPTRAIALLLELADSGVTLTTRQYIEVQVDPLLWRDIKEFASLWRHANVPKRPEVK